MDQSKLEFVECDICNSKPGSPRLCSGCVHNRQVIEDLRALLGKCKRAVDYVCGNLLTDSRSTQLDALNRELDGFANPGTSVAPSDAIALLRESQKLYIGTDAGVNWQRRRDVLLATPDEFSRCTCLMPFDRKPGPHHSLACPLNQPKEQT